MLKQTTQVWDQEITKRARRINDQKDGDETTYTKSLVEQINCVLHITGDQTSSANKLKPEINAEYTSLTQQMTGRPKEHRLQLFMNIGQDKLNSSLK